jgi:leucyl-tRNA synthetase
MECLNEIQEAGKKLNQEQIEFYMKMLAPLAPFIASEMWERLGHKDFIDHAVWPKLNPEMLVQTDFELVLQVNGKLRKRLKMQLNPVEAEVVEIGKKELADYLAGKAIVKAIYVPNKLLNIVVK